MPAVTLQDKIRKNDTMVYWARSTSKDKYGEYTFAVGVEKSVRWWTREEEFTEPEGQILMSRALVYPGETLVLYSYVYHGKLTDLPLADRNDPEKLKDSFEILQIKHATLTPWIKNNHTLYQYYLI